MCISHTKPDVGDNKTVFTTQEVCKSAAQWFFPSKIFLKYNEVSTTFQSSKFKISSGGEGRGV